MKIKGQKSFKKGLVFDNHNSPYHFNTEQEAKSFIKNNQLKQKKPYEVLNSGKVIL